MFRKGYHLVHFLDDFMSYYNKGPNFARNAIHKGSIDIGCTQEWINANQLYNYVLSHETVYGLTVVRMEPIYIEEIESNLELDYALVRHSTYKLKQSEDVNVTLVVSYDKKNAKPEDSLKLNFYILISMKEINPTSANNESQSGIFRTVTPEQVMTIFTVYLHSKKIVKIFILDFFPKFFLKFFRFFFLTGRKIKTR